MKFWTFQTKQAHETLSAGNRYIADFSKVTDANRKEPYQYILELYNAKYHTDYKSLIFGHIGNSNHVTLDTEEDLYKMLEEEGKPGGSWYSNKTHVLYQLEIPINIGLMPIDYYKFCDLIYFMEEGPDAEIVLSKKILFKPNNPDGTYQLLQAHIPYIEPSWIVKCVKPIYE